MSLSRMLKQVSSYGRRVSSWRRHRRRSTHSLRQSESHCRSLRSWSGCRACCPARVAPCLTTSFAQRWDDSTTQCASPSPTRRSKMRSGTLPNFGRCRNGRWAWSGRTSCRCLRRRHAPLLASSLQNMAPCRLRAPCLLKRRRSTCAFEPLRRAFGRSLRRWSRVLTSRQTMANSFVTAEKRTLQSVVRTSLRWSQQTWRSR
mmetsp:Transcript_11257/g.35723  ORF Transcript_11257/g.35723 Transcript_11257/m.35723 type:complete len:202 (-) Transcript_11257:1989-2594(-)